jgi:hypothetical protein
MWTIETIGRNKRTRTYYAFPGPGSDGLVTIKVESEDPEDVVKWANRIDAVDDLLAVLEAILAPNHTPETYDAAMRLARAAIARARGTASGYDERDWRERHPPAGARGTA